MDVDWDAGDDEDEATAGFVSCGAGFGAEGAGTVTSGNGGVVGAGPGGGGARGGLTRTGCFAPWPWRTG